MSDAPIIAQKAPYPVDLEAGKTYFWCACGQSSPATCQRPSALSRTSSSGASSTSWSSCPSKAERRLSATRTWGRCSAGRPCACRVALPRHALLSSPAVRPPAPATTTAAAAVDSHQTHPFRIRQ